MRRALAAAAVVLATAPAASAAGGPIAFGRSGGNIVPFRVTISAAGAVAASGPVQVRRARLSPAALARLRRLAVRDGFASLPARTACPDTLPDVASTYVALGGRTVLVHGGCVAGYAALWRALAAAVGLGYS